MRIGSFSVNVFLPETFYCYSQVFLNELLAKEMLQFMIAIAIMLIINSSVDNAAKKRRCSSLTWFGFKALKGSSSRSSEASVQGSFRTLSFHA